MQGKSSTLLGLSNLRLDIRVVGILPIEKQTKESARRDKRLSSVYCVSVSCLYCIGQKHLLVGASLSTVCLYCVKHLLAYFLKQLLAYFQKHLLAYFRKHLSLCWSIFVNSCWPIFKKHLTRVCAPSLPPSPTQGREGQGMEGEEVGKELVGAIEVVQTSECSNKLY